MAQGSLLGVVLPQEMHPPKQKKAKINLEEEEEEKKKRRRKPPRIFKPEMKQHE